MIGHGQHTLVVPHMMQFPWAMQYSLSPQGKQQAMIEGNLPP
jgi:hypothetical protein